MAGVKVTIPETCEVALPSFASTLDLPGASPQATRCPREIENVRPDGSYGLIGLHRGHDQYLSWRIVQQITLRAQQMPAGPRPRQKSRRTPLLALLSDS